MLRSFGKIKTNDFEEFCDWNLAHGIELNHRQLQRGRGSSEATFAVFDEMILWSYRESRRMLVEFAIPDGWVEFCFAEFAENPIWCGRNIPTSSVAIHGGGKHYDCVLPEGGRTSGILLRKSMLPDSGNLLEDIAENTDGDPLIARKSTSSARLIADTINNLLENPPKTATSKENHDDVLANCNQLVDEVILHRANCRYVNERKLVDLARQSIRCRRNDSFTINDLLEDLDVSRRTLELAFRKQLGVSPYQFLIIERLCVARRLLKRSQKSVLEVCMESGFDDASRFSRMYARHFGELPSRTLRNSVPTRG